MSEIAKEKTEFTDVPDKLEIPKIEPKESFSLEQADTVFGKMWSIDNVPNWVQKNEDGQVFYGYDDGDGNTTWYDSEMNLDSSTPTPTEGDICDSLYPYES